MKILISGAGIAGLTIAYWLKRYGFTPTIIERTPTLQTGGYKIDARGSALQVLHWMDIYNDVMAASTDMQGAVLVDKNGKIISRMSGDAFGHRVGEDVEIIRGSLCQILMSKIPEIEYIFGNSIQAISQASDSKKVNVTLKDNEIREFDLVIGADGLHSNVRNLVFGKESSYLLPLGMYLCVFTLPNYLHLDRIEMQYSEFGRIAAVWSARGEANMKACFGFSYSSSTIDLRDRNQQEQILKNTYADIGWEIPKFMQLMPDSSDFYFDAAAQINMDQWFKARVVLVGDAAYCASPMSGQGTSLAIIGAYILAGELASAQGSYEPAFTEYESKMRPFVKVNQALGITAANRMRVQEKNNLLTTMFIKIMQLMPGSFIKFIINFSTRHIHKAANSIKLKSY